MLNIDQLRQKCINGLQSSPTGVLQEIIMTCNDQRATGFPPAAETTKTPVCIGRLAAILAPVYLLSRDVPENSEHIIASEILHCTCRVVADLFSELGLDIVGHVSGIEQSSLGPDGPTIYTPAMSVDTAPIVGAVLSLVGVEAQNDPYQLTRPPAETPSNGESDEPSAT